MKSKQAERNISELNFYSDFSKSGCLTCMERIKKLLTTATFLACFAAVSMANDCVQVNYDHCFQGCPKGIPDNSTLIRRAIYTLSNNQDTKFADWVAYKITMAEVSGKGSLSRVWKADPCLEENTTMEPDDYKGAPKALKIDRGHQAPLASFKGTKTWSDTNYLSNITPQRAALNQGAWVRLENRERDFVLKGNTLWVITGPLYERDMTPMPNAKKAHKVPSGYWKILLTESSDKIEAVAFIFQQETPKPATVLEHLTSIDEIEERTGLDLFHMLKDSVEEKLEKKINRPWAEQHFGP